MENYVLLENWRLIICPQMISLQGDLENNKKIQHNLNEPFNDVSESSIGVYFVINTQRSECQWFSLPFAISLPVN